MKQLKALVFAGFLGYVLGILFAPKKGEELRGDLKEFFEDWQNKGIDAVSTIGSKGQNFYAQAQPTLNKVKDEAKNLQSKASSSFKEAMTRNS